MDSRFNVPSVTRTVLAATHAELWTPGLMSHRSPGPGRCRVMGSRFNVPSLCRTAFAARTLRSWTPGLTSRRSPARCLLHACGAMDSRFNVPSVTRAAFAARRLRSWTPGLTSRRSPGQCRVTIIMYSRYNVPSVIWVACFFASVTHVFCDGG